MTTDRTEAVIDADGHVFESDSDIFEYLPAPYRGSDILFATPFFPTLDGFHRQAQRVTDGRSGMLEVPTGEDWLAYLDEANIAASVLFPTGGLAFGMIPDPDWASALAHGDRKSTRLNSSHRCISYAVFCLKKKKNKRRCV